MPSIISLALVGSYARKEENQKSDVDILGITTSLNKKIQHGKYEITLISEENLKKELENNIIPLLPMLIEAKPLLNKKLIETYSSTKINSKNLKWHIETTKSALGFSEKAIEIAEESKENVSDNIIYSLILRLREAYIIDSIIDKKKFSNSGLKALIKSLSDSYSPYESYQRAKKEPSKLKKVDSTQSRKILKYLLSRIEAQEKWIEKRD